MDNQDLNNQNIDVENQAVNNTSQPTIQGQTPAPSLMRESIDQNGNVVTPSNNQGPDNADKIINAVEGIVNTQDHKNEFTVDEIKKFKASCMVSYIPLVSLYFVVSNKVKQSVYLKFHVNQGLLITILWVIVFFISSILKSLFTTNSLLRNSTPGWVSLISYILYCICFVLTIFGIINTYNDSSKELPLLGKIKLLK